MNRLQRFIRHNAIYRLFAPVIPADHHGSWSAERYARAFLGGSPAGARVLDLGCGAGGTRELFRSIAPRCDWYGAELAASPELEGAASAGAGICLFDGTHLPWVDGFFDLVYCHQVLEHVRRPDELLADVFRVLRPGGVFAGSVSYLEPYHSLSFFNFTPYGIMTVLADAGFRLAEMRPGHDCCSVIGRQMVGGHPGMSRLMKRLSPVAAAIGIAGAVCGLDHRARNFLKIQFAGHICFLACKDPAGSRRSGAGAAGPGSA